MTPTTLDRAALGAWIPHRGPMCLLERMSAWSASAIECIAVNHRDPRHPLRSASGLLASAAIEYAAQAMALHGALAPTPRATAPRPGSRQRARRPPRARRPRRPAGRNSRRAVVRAERQAADAGRILYAFRVLHDGCEIASGRIAVVLDVAREARA